MRLSIRTSVLALALGVATVASAAGTSFLDKSTSTQSDLVMAARVDSVVMDRYMRHFSMNRTDVIEFVSSLHSDVVKTDGLYKVYSVPNGSRVVEQMVSLKVGEPILVDAAGAPAILLAGGNPMTLGPNARIDDTDVATATSAKDESSIKTSKSESTTIAVQRTQIEAINDALTLTQGDKAIVGGSSNNGTAGIIAAVVGIGGIAILASQGDDNNAPVVPEPASMVIMGTGLAAFMKRRRAAKKD